MYMLRAVIGDESRNDRQILKKCLKKFPDFIYYYTRHIREIDDKLCSSPSKLFRQIIR
jgi:hypothetical protein